MERRIAAIFAADMVGYSRLMEADETGTIQRQKVHFAELILPTIEKHNGRIVKLMGDGLLVEFASVVDAVQCAVTIQRAMALREEDVSDHRRIQYRVGINLGDIVIEEDDIFGHGVNVAARLESMAPPGGVVISGTAHDMLKSNVEVDYVSLGEVQVKNIQEPVRVYQVVLEGAARTTSTQPDGARRGTAGRTAIAIASIVATLLLLGGGWWWVAGPRMARTSDGLSPSILERPSGPSVAIMPFETLGAFDEIGWIAKGLAIDITQNLTLYKRIRVVGRSATARYDAPSVDMLAAGRAMNVEFVLAGTVRGDEERLRVNIELIRTDNGEQLWAEAFDGDLAVQRVFDLQDRITENVINTIGGAYGLLVEDARQHLPRANVAELNSFECIVLAYEYAQWLSPDSHLRARDCLEKTVKTEPEYSDAWAQLSYIYAGEYSLGYNRRKRPLQRALEAAETAIRLAANSHGAWVKLANARFLADDRKGFVEAAKRALEITSNDAETLGQISLLFSLSGDHDVAIPLIDKAVDLTPFPPFWWYVVYSNAAQDSGNWEEVLRLSLQHDLPGHFWTWGRRAAAYGNLGETEKAREAVAKLLELRPDFPA